MTTTFLFVENRFEGFNVLKIIGGREKKTLILIAEKKMYLDLMAHIVSLVQFVLKTIYKSCFFFFLLDQRCIRNYCI